MGIKTKDLDDLVQVLTLKTDLDYWPTRELVLGPDGWEVAD